MSSESVGVSLFLYDASSNNNPTHLERFFFLQENLSEILVQVGGEGHYLPKTLSIKKSRSVKVAQGCIIVLFL